MVATFAFKSKLDYFGLNATHNEKSSCHSSGSDTAQPGRSNRKIIGAIISVFGSLRTTRAAWTMAYVTVDTTGKRVQMMDGTRNN